MFAVRDIFLRSSYRISWKPKRILAIGSRTTCVFMISLAPFQIHAEPVEALQPRLLFLYSAHSTLSANVEATAGAMRGFSSGAATDYEVYAEFRDDQRFPGAEADRAFVAEMDSRFHGQRFDAILAFGNFALHYAMKHRDTFAPFIPVVFGGVTNETLEGVDLPSDIRGVRSTYSVARTLALARRLLPDAERVVIFTGSSAFDRSWRSRARDEVRGVSGVTID